MTINKELIIDFQELLKSLYPDEVNQYILHRPYFNEREKEMLSECIDSNFVSSAGKEITIFEDMVKNYTGAKHAIAVVNGTAALHLALIGCEVGLDDEVITQPLTFVATCNAISYCGAKPVFIDISRNSLGMCPISLKHFLERSCKQINNKLVNKKTGRIIKACIPMHTFGNPCEISEIKGLCDNYGIDLVEDAAESLGSFDNKTHTGTQGKFGTLSFNGNKIITTGGGGMLITNNDSDALKLRHIATTGKLAHSYKYYHDIVAYNYRMPNLNACLGIAQMEKLQTFLSLKSKLSELYENFFENRGITFFRPSTGYISNNWLNAILLKNEAERDIFLELSNDSGIQTRPCWELMNKLPMFKNCHIEDISVAELLAKKIVNIPSSVPNSLKI